MTCLSCNQNIEGWAEFCPNCGAKITTKRGWAGSSVWIYVYAAAFAVLVFLALNPARDRFSTPEKVTPPAQKQAQPEKETTDHPMLVELETQAKNGDPEALLNLAEAAYQLSTQDPHFLPRAVAPLKRFIESHPNHSYALRFLGNVYYDLKQPKNAIPIYRRYLDLNPNDANVFTDMGTQLLFDEQYDAAIQAYQRAIQIFPDHYHAHRNLHIAFQQIGNADQAQKYLTLSAKIESLHGKILAPALEHPRLP